MSEVSIARRSGGVWNLFLTASMLLTLSAPALAGEIYSWRTEDGGYAFTDDPDAIPKRYRGQIETRKTVGLSDYARYTAQNDEATDHYAERLGDRVDRLRQINATPGASAARRPTAAPHATSAPDYVNLRTGPSDQAGVDLSVPTNANSREPLVVETVFMRLEGSDVVQRVQVTRQGDRVVAITKPSPTNWSLSDTVDEADLRDALER